MGTFSMFDLFTDCLEDREFDSLEDYENAVKQLSNDVEEELGRAERWALSNDPEVYQYLGVKIKGVYPDPEEKE